MFQIECVKGLPSTGSNSGDEAVHDADAMAEVELLEPLLGLLRIARLQVENDILCQRFTEGPLLLFISGPEQDLHPDSYWDAQDQPLNGG